MARSKIITLNSGYHLWTRSIGHGPIKLLLVHGGPGMTHEYFESFEDALDPDKYEFFYYDQLGSYFSDQPDDERLWTLPRFTDELEEVREQLGLDQFVVLGQSWGGMVAIEYALKYGQHLKGLIVSNMVDNIADYADYIGKLRERELSSEDVATMKGYEAKSDFDAPEYVALCMKLYESCICRKTPWPDAVQRTFAHLNEQVYVTLQGPNEFTITGSMGSWDVRDRLGDIDVPTLLLGAVHDSMNPDTIRSMAERIPAATAHICPEGSHFSMWDDADDYFAALEEFLRSLD